MDPVAAFEQYEKEALAALGAAADVDALEAARVEFLGKKRGRLRDLQTLLGKAPPDQRPLLGRRFNEVKNRVTEAWRRRKQELETPKAASTRLDITLPG
ncbi:MAG TPA: phenylalanine--tRNA ligase subunit alpha, partial [Planctomycetaceae bacterium]|nr:phenylalanine--tRNA ligase subunit alpha [Planctomycetaceae bacterium]